MLTFLYITTKLLTVQLPYYFAASRQKYFSSAQLKTVILQLIFEVIVTWKNHP